MSYSQVPHTVQKRAWYSAWKAGSGHGVILILPTTVTDLTKDQRDSKLC